MPYRNEVVGDAAKGRPRDPHKEASILAATLSLLADRGYDELSIEAVAALAGTSKATVYRRWATKRDLVVAAISVQQGPEVAPINTGSLRGDLLALARRLAEMLSKAEGRLIVALLQGTAKDRVLGDFLETSAGHTGAKMPQNVLRRAIARGELHPSASPFSFDEVVGACLILRALTGSEISDPYLEHLIDTVVLPALKRDTGEQTPPSPAFFARTPEASTGSDN